MIGQAGLTDQPYLDTQVLEVGYLLEPVHWRRSYTTEAARACRDDAFGPLGEDKVSSMIKSDNAPSIRVAERLGMTREAGFTARYFSGEQPHVLYSARRADAAACFFAGSMLP